MGRVRGCWRAVHRSSRVGLLQEPVVTVEARRHLCLLGIWPPALSASRPPTARLCVHPLSVLSSLRKVLAPVPSASSHGGNENGVQQRIGPMVLSRYVA